MLVGEEVNWESKFSSDCNHAEGNVGSRNVTRVLGIDKELHCFEDSPHRIPLV